MFTVLQRFFFLSIKKIDLLELLSFDKLDCFDDESDDYGSEYGFPGMCNFLFCSRNSVGRASGVGSGNFFPTGIDSIGDVVPLVVF